MLASQRLAPVLHIIVILQAVIQTITQISVQITSSVWGGGPVNEAPGGYVVTLRTPCFRSVCFMTQFYPMILGLHCKVVLILAALLGFSIRAFYDNAGGTDHDFPRH